ncbi:MAG: hypothetical protein ACOCZ7_01780 [Armatimonadota bacterium]
MSNSICGAKTRAGTRCELRAGWGTDHVGEGRCKLHGGKTPRGADSPHFRHGQRSAYFDVNSVVEFAEWKETVGLTLALEDDLLYLVWLAREGLKPGATITVNTKDGLAQTNPDPVYIATVADKLSRSWDRMKRRREGETIHVKIAQPEVERLFAAVGDAIGEHVSDPEEAERVLAAIQNAADTYHQARQDLSDT